MIRSMITLNAGASRAALALDARCATDVTGFGLLGHATHIARASGVSLRIDVARVPILPGARAAWKLGARTGGAERNSTGSSARSAGAPRPKPSARSSWTRRRRADCSLAVPAAALAEYLSRVSGATVIGAVVPREEKEITLA